MRISDWSSDVCSSDLRNVARDVLGSEARIARGDFEFLDVDRGEDVVLHDAFGNEDTILIVVAVPRHERDERILAERQFAKLGRRTVGDDVAGTDAFADLHQRNLVDRSEAQHVGKEGGSEGKSCWG